MTLATYPEDGSLPYAWGPVLKTYLDQCQFNAHSRLNSGRMRDIGGYWLDKGQQFSQTQVSGIVYCGNDIVVAGTFNGNYIIRSTDGGETFTNLGAQSAGSVSLPTYFGNGVVLASVYGNGRVIRSTDYGATWSDLGALFSGTSGFKISNLGGGVAIYSGNNGIWGISTDRGATWTDKGLLHASAGTLGDADTDREGTAFLFTGGATYGLILFKSTDEGASWTYHLKIGAETGCVAMQYFDNGVWVLLSNSGHIWRSVDNGETWTDVGAVTAAGSTGELWRGGEGIILAASGGDGHIYRSDNQGATWRDMGAVGSETGIVCGCAMENYCQVIGTGSGHVWKQAA